MWYGEQTDSKNFPIAIFLRFGIFNKLGKFKVARKVHEEATSQGGAPYPPGRAPVACGHPVHPLDSVFLWYTPLGL